MIRLSNSAFDIRFTESAVNEEIDSVMHKIFGDISVSNTRIHSLNLQDSGKYTLWSDQRRVGKVFLFTAMGGELFACIKFRLEFIDTLDLYKVIEEVALEIRSAHIGNGDKELFILYRDLSQGDGKQFLPSICGVTWFCL